MDEICASTVAKLLSDVDDCKEDERKGTDLDALGRMHIIFCGDFKQLPPASSQAPFIRLPWVLQLFDIRVLRQNRRVIAGEGASADEIETFHGVLEDISMGKAAALVCRSGLGEE